MPLEQEGSKSVVRAWLKKVGDAVKQDEPIVELETDKVAVEVPAPADGVLTSIALNEGDEAAPGATLGVLNTSVIPDARSASRDPVAKSAPAALGSGSALRSARDDATSLNEDSADPLVAAKIQQLETYLAEVQARGLSQLDRKILRSGLFNQFETPTAEEKPGN